MVKSYMEEYTSRLRKYIEKKLEKMGAEPNIKEIPGYDGDAFDWIFGKTECTLNFYKNGSGKTHLFLDLAFSNEQGLAKKVRDAISSTKIDKSPYLRRPHKETLSIREENTFIRDVKGEERQSTDSVFKSYIESGYNRTPDKDYLLLTCELKKTPSSKKAMENLIEEIWSKLIGPTCGTAIGWIK